MAWSPTFFPSRGTELCEKVSYVARFAPWDLVFVAGAYVDDLNVTFHATLLRLTLMGGDNRRRHYPRRVVD